MCDERRQWELSPELLSMPCTLSSALSDAADVVQEIP